MSTRDSAAALEEEAELRELRDRADRTTAEAARTLAELGGQLADRQVPDIFTLHGLAATALLPLQTGVRRLVGAALGTR